MPKATKRSKEKHADFVKAKLKLGKGKKQPSNATDTSFKARTIALPGQHVLDRTVTPSSEPVTAGGLTLDEVIIRLRHPNAGMRRDALSGIKEIALINHAREVGKILRALGAVISDDESSVRKSLISLVGWYLPLHTQATLSPHLPLLLLQTSSGLSHIFPEIRLDSCKLVRVLLEHVPAHIVGSWPGSGSITENSGDGGKNTILEGLRLALGLQGDTGSSMSKTGSQGRLVALETMLAFLRNALQTQRGDKQPGSSFAPGFFGERAGRGSAKGKERAVDPPMYAPGEYGHLLGQAMVRDAVTGWEIGGLGFSGTEGADNGKFVLATLYIQLAPLLLSTFMESAPTAFAPNRSDSTSVDDVALSLCLVSASLTDTLAQPILSSCDPQPIVRQCVVDFLRRMSPYFPFPNRAFPTGVSPCLEMSLAFASPTMALLPTPPRLVLPRSAASHGWNGRVKAIEQAWSQAGSLAASAKRGSKKSGFSVEWALGEVADWISTVLETTKDVLVPSITPIAYRAILPIIASLLTAPTPDHADEAAAVYSQVGEAFLSHLLRTSSTSLIRAAGDELLCGLVLAHEDLQSDIPFFLPVGSSLRPMIRTWLESLPRTLWEIGQKNDEATRNILEFLLEIGLRGKESFVAPWSLLHPEIFEDMSSKLSSYFYVSHPSKGPIPGPWTRLADIKLKKLALDVARVWAEYSGGSLREAVVRAVQGTELEAYWTRASL